MSTTTATTPCPLHRWRHAVDLSLGRLARLIEAGLVRVSAPRLKPVWLTVEVIAGSDEIMLRTAEWRARLQLEGAIG